VNFNYGFLYDLEPLHNRLALDMSLQSRAVIGSLLTDYLLISYSRGAMRNR